MNVAIIETRDVKLSEDEARRVAREVIRERLRIPERAFIKVEADSGRAMLCYSYEGPAPYRDTMVEGVREASELDKAALRVLATLT